MVGTKIWLWQENDQVRVFAPDATRLFAGMPECEDPGRENQHLRDVKKNTALTQIRQPAGFADFLRDIVQSARTPVELRLTVDLPNEWRDFPFEWLDYQGKALQERLLVTRDVQKPGEGEIPGCKSQGVILNLWPGAEPVQPVSNIVPHYSGLQRKDRIGPVKAFMAGENLHNYGLLVVIAHGSEGAMDMPFRLEDGQGWALPTGRGLPDLVILLACGGEDGNLLAYGRSLLEAGARTVLAPRGQLDARQATKFLHDFLDGWLKQGLSVAEALHKTQRDDQSTRTGAARLYLLGEPDLHCQAASDRPEWLSLEQLQNQVVTELATEGPAPTLPVWCERLTLCHYRRYGNLDKLELEREIKETPRPRLLQQLYPVRNALPHLTQLWVKPALAYLAEAHDHGLLESLEKERADLEKPGGAMTSPSYFRHWHKVYYRKGQYALAVRDLVKGLRPLQAEDYPLHGRGLLGSLLNILKDQTLIPPAIQVDRQLELCLGRGTDREEVERHKRNALDRKAGLALREGDVDQAIACYQQRWQENAAKPDERALYWLLYITAWHPVREDRRYLQKAMDLLNTGEKTDVYLLRALAAWAWCRSDATVAERLAAEIPACEARLRDNSQDAGPPGFVLAYLHLYARQHTPDWQDQLPTREFVLTALNQQRYYLEETAFCHLFGDCNKAERRLQTFQQQRREVVAELRDWQPDWFKNDWDLILQQQEEKENSVFLTVAPDPVRHLLESGLLPL